MQIESCTFKFDYNTTDEVMEYEKDQNINENNDPLIQSFKLNNDSSEFNLNSQSSNKLIKFNLKKELINNSFDKTHIANFTNRLNAIESILLEKIPIEKMELRERLNQHLLEYSNFYKDDNSLLKIKKRKDIDFQNIYYLSPESINDKEMNENLLNISKLDKFYQDWAQQNMIDELIALYFGVVQSSYPSIDKAAFKFKKGCSSPALIYAMCAYSVKFSCNESWFTIPRYKLSERFFNVSRQAILNEDYKASQANMQALNMLGTLCFEQEALSWNLIGASIKMGQQLNCQYILEEGQIPILDDELDSIKEKCRAWMFCLELERTASLIFQKPLMQKYTAKDGGKNIENLELPFEVDKIAVSTKIENDYMIIQRKNVENYASIIRYFFFTLRLLTQKIQAFNINEDKVDFKSTTPLLNYLQKLNFTFPKLNAQLPDPKLRLMMRNFSTFARTLLSTITLLHFFPKLIYKEFKLTNRSNITHLNQRIFNRSVLSALQIASVAKVVSQRKTNQRVNSSICFDFFVAACFLKKLNRDQPTINVPIDALDHLILALKHLSSYWAFAKVCLSKLEELDI